MSKEQDIYLQSLHAYAGQLAFSIAESASTVEYCQEQIGILRARIKAEKRQIALNTKMVALTNQKLSKS